MFAQLAMGGYATYVWSAYGLVIAVLVVNGWMTQAQKRQVRKILDVS